MVAIMNFMPEHTFHTRHVRDITEAEAVKFCF